MSLSGKIALVTGGSRGIGKSIAFRLAQEGADVAVSYKSNQAAAEAVVREIEAQGRKGMAVACDVSNMDEVEKMLAACVENFGAPDVLINNATTYRSDKVHKLPVEDWHTVLNSCLSGAFYCTRLAVPHMLEKGWGRIVNISSGSGLHGFPGDIAYSTAKAGLLGFTKSLAKEVSSKGVLVNCVVPGLIPTDLTAGIPEKSYKYMESIIPMKRAGTAEEVAEVVAFLVSRASYVNGEVICVDGGLNI